MDSMTGLFSTLILAGGIGYLTIRGFRREAANLKNGTCCGSESCSCGCGSGCGGNSGGECQHCGELKQTPENTEKP